MSALSNVTCATFALAIMSVGCGSGGPNPSPNGEDATTSMNDAESAENEDGGQFLTSVNGTLAGTSFHLAHSSVEFGEVVSTICASDEPITAPDCGLSEEDGKFVFIGRFGFDGSGGAQWSLGLTQIHNTAGGGEIAEDGQLTVTTFDEAAGKVALTMTVTFASGVTDGSIYVGF